MSSKSLPLTLLVCAFALVPAALGAEPATNVGAPTRAPSMLDVPIEDIAASERGSAILDKDFPELRGHAMYSFFKVMSLNQIAAMSRGKITRAMLAQARTDLSVLPVKAVARPVVLEEVEDPAPPASGNQAARNDR